MFCAMMATMNDTLLPCDLYTAAEVRRLDRCAIDDHGIPSAELIRRAAAAAFSFCRRHFPGAGRIVVVCGIGNNGADGYVFARLAHQASFRVTVLQVGATYRLSADAALARAESLAAGVSVQDFASAALAGQDLIVDALLGTGLERPVSGVYAEIVNDINNANTPVLALDLPSGIHADSGAILNVAVKAMATISFVALKRGLFTGDGPDCCGTLGYSDLGISPSVFAGLPASAQRLNRACMTRVLGPRRLNSHKGRYGHVWVLGGNHGMAGAVRLAGEAALRVGAGLVSVATRAEHTAAISGPRPELMCHGVENEAQLNALLAQATVIAVGPGMGRDAWSQSLLDAAFSSSKPLVVDADALILLSEAPRNRLNWILTPHPGEAARLLGGTVAEVMADRFAACTEIQKKYGGVCVLKGAGTLVSDGSRFGVCSLGNPRMATAGMGDALTGIVAGLAAQALANGRTLFDIACAAVHLHARAGDAASEVGKVGLITTDIFPFLRAWADEV